MCVCKKVAELGHGCKVETPEQSRQELAEEWLDESNTNLVRSLYLILMLIALA